MNRNKLKLIDSKTEFIIFGSKSKIPWIKTTLLRVGEEDIKAANQIRNIRAFFNSELKMNTQINNKCKSAGFHLYDISKIRHYLSQDQTKLIVHAYVTSKLDSNNSLLAGITLEQRWRLESVQHAAARLNTRSNKYDHVNPLLRKLHWLPVEYRIKFKILLLAYKTLNGKGPVYLKDLLKFPDSPHQLRSVDSLTLEYPRTRTSYGDRAFSIAAAKEWNRLTDEIKSCTSVNSFISLLKTRLFQIHFKWFLILK